MSEKKLEYKYENLVKARDAFSRTLMLYEKEYDIATDIHKEAYTASVIQTTHVYDEKMAQNICHDIEELSSSMNVLVDRIKPI